ncbi:MAG TPA: hypothetical protein VH814_25820 [Steroidobacteraceae bacterium]|jgi:hypothetical protein
MSWMPASHKSEAPTTGAKAAILENVHRGLLLASASRRLQDTISAHRASTEARQLLTAAKRLCEEEPELAANDERVRAAIASLTVALDDR